LCLLSNEHRPDPCLVTLPSRDNPEYADYFLTADDWRLRVKICRVTYAPNNPNPWHLHFHSHSDTAHFIMSGDGEALMENDTWAPVQAGDLIYAKPGQVHGIRVTRPDCMSGMSR
jgi:mannose-6-phosphate isomerase-like protein (cupin superfamily)